MLTKLIFSVGPLLNCRSQCSRGLRRSSEAALSEIEGSKDTGWISVCCGCCVL